MSKTSRRRNRRRNSDIPVVANNSESEPNIAAASGSNPVPLKIGVPYPPDYVFKHRERNRKDPAEEVWGTGSISYAPVRAEYVEGEGCFIYYLNVPFPSKGHATVEAVWAMGSLKRLILRDFKFLGMREMRLPLAMLALIGRRRRTALLNAYCRELINIGIVTVYPYYLEDGYYCPAAKEIRKGMEAFLVELGVVQELAEQTAEIAGLFVEDDDAYRLRVQDLAGETMKEDLLYDFPEEADRLLKLLSERECLKEGLVAERFGSMVKLIKYAWHIPNLRKAVRKGIEAVDFDKLRLDEADIYHSCLRADYNAQGKTMEERIKILESYHGQDQTSGLWPPRIMVKQKPS